MKASSTKRNGKFVIEERFINLSVNIPVSVYLSTGSQKTKFFKIYYIIIRKGFSSGVLPATVALQYVDGVSAPEIPMDKLTVAATATPSTGFPGIMTTTVDYKFYFFPNGLVVSDDAAVKIANPTAGMAEVKIIGERL